MSDEAMKLLRDEHDVISAATRVLDAIDGSWERSTEDYETALDDLVLFLATYSDGFHHQKEERVLFPALRNHPDFTMQGLLDELEDQHQTFRDEVAAVRRARDEKKYAVAQAALRRYFNALLDHIAVENDELLPMTESIFGPGDLEKIYFRFKDIDNELGADVKRAIESKMMKGQTP